MSIYDFMEETTPKVSMSNYTLRIMGQSGSGKAQPLYSKILTKSGWITFEDVKAGDKIVGFDGKEYDVLNVYDRGIRDIVEITFKDGSTVRCCDEHLWSVNKCSQKKYTNDNMYTFETKDMIDSIKAYGGSHRYLVPVNNPIVCFDEVEHIVHPYLLGLLIGDGYIKDKDIILSNSECDIIENARNVLPIGMSIRKNIGNNYSWRIAKGDNENRNIINSEIKRMNLKCGSYDKFIPREYMIDSYENRLELLKGIFDSDGCINSNGSRSISTISVKLRDDIIELAKSLGYRSSYNVDKRTYKDGGNCYSVVIWTDDVIYKSKKHLSRHKKYKRIVNRHRLPIVDIKYIGKDKVRCISTNAPLQLYITDDYIVTHNTPAYSTFARELSKREYNGKVVCALLPLEDRYDHINGLMVIKPAMKDKMGRIIKDANGKPKLKKVIESWDDFVEVVDKLVDAKMNIENFQIERVCIDTTTKLEMLAQQQVVKLWFQESGKLQDFNECFGSFGRNHAKAIEICRIEKRKLESVGYKVDQIVQARVKSQVKPITGQEYHVVASDSGEGFDGKVFLQDASISFYIVEEAVVGQTGITKQGKVINGLSTNGKVFMLNSDGEYKGCKSPFPNTPTSIPADDFDLAVSQYFDLFESEMSKLSGISTEQYKEKAQVEKVDLADKLKENLETIKHELQEESANNARTEEINKFIVHYDSVKKTFSPEVLGQCQAYFESLMAQQKTTTLADTLISLDDNTLNGIYGNFGFTR